MKRVFSIVLITYLLTLSLVLLPINTEKTRAYAETIEERLQNELSTSYAKALQHSGMSSFTDYCGACTGHQLWAVGLFNSYIGFNGNGAYDELKNRVPDNGVSVTLFPGVCKQGTYTIEQICNILNASNPYGRQTYTVFAFHTGTASNNGQAYGHVLLVHAVYNGNVYWCDTFGSSLVDSISGFANRYATSGSVFNFDGAVAYDLPHMGWEMPTGYDRVLPDGDYAIVSAQDPKYILAVTGGAYPAQNETNVQIYGVSNPSNYDVALQDVWTITYSDGFYWIRQRGTSLALTVYHGSIFEGENVYIAYDNGSSAQKWAISYSNDGRKGYHLQAKCSSFNLNIADRNMVSGNNVNQYGSDGTDSQGWMFIPYKPSQRLAKGRYILVSAINDAYELDVDGDTGNVENGTNVAIWNHNSTAFYENALSQYNSFDVVPLANGYYKLIHVASGKGLASLGGGVANNQNIGIYEENGDSAHEWAITPHGYDGGFVLRPKCSGLAMDVVDGTAANGTNVRQHWFSGAKGQTWQFVPAEYTVEYNANGGTGAPNAQTKYYKGKLELSETVPVRTGYTFIGWATEADTMNVEYQPGDVYNTDEDIMLYAIWHKQDVLTLPSALDRIEEEAFMGCNANIVIIPQGCEEISTRAFANCRSLTDIYIPSSVHTISRTAFTGCSVSLVIHGEPDSTAQSFAEAQGFVFALTEP